VALGSPDGLGKISEPDPLDLDPVIGVGLAGCGPVLGAVLAPGDGVLVADVMGPVPADGLDP
jgi:hypothetical protein